MRASAVARAMTIGRLRSEVRTALARHRSARRTVGQEVRRALHEHHAAFVASIRGGPAEDRAAPPPDAESVKDVPLWQVWPAAERGGDADPTCGILEAQILRIVQDHPDGIRAREVGNELGVDWRWVVGIAQNLLEAGQIEQVAQEFYPAGKVRQA